MKKLSASLLMLIISVLFPPRSFALIPYISDPDIKIINNDITVSTSITNIDDLEEAVNSGVGKEIIFTLELMRVWDFWPDEFVVSKKVRNVIKYDNLRNYYLTSSSDTIKQTDRKFTDFNLMMGWISTVNSLAIANIKELEPGSYYIRVIVETKSRRQLPIIGLLKYLIPEIEKSLAKESQPFSVPGKTS